MPQRRNKTEKEIEKEILMKIFKQKKKMLKERGSREEIDEIREIIRKLRRLRGL